jgi:hypothetical protein
MLLAMTSYTGRVGNFGAAIFTTGRLGICRDMSRSHVVANTALRPKKAILEIGVSFYETGAYALLQNSAATPRATD